MDATSFARVIDAIPLVDNAAVRDALLPNPAVRQRVENLATRYVEMWNGVQWLPDGVLASVGTLFNVRSYGALGDGVTDDTAAIQNAINAAQAAGAGSVYIPSATHIISGLAGQACLTLTGSNVRVFGDGPPSILKVKNATPIATALLVQSANPAVSQITNVVLSEFAIDGNKANQVGSYDMKNVRVCPSDQVAVPANITISRLFSYNAFSGHLPTEAGGISIEGSDHALPQGTSTLDYSPQNILVTGCVCYNNNGWGIGSNWGNGIQFIANRTYGNDTMGLTLWNTQDAVVSGNWSYGNIDYAINVEASDRILVVGNRLNGLTNGAISVYNSLDVTIDANDITHNSNSNLFPAVKIRSGAGYSGSGTGTFKQRATQRVRVTNSRIVKTGSDGWAVFIDVPDAATPTQYQTDILVQNNEIRNDGNQAKAIALQGLRVSALNNRVTGKVFLNGYTDEAHCDGNLISAVFGSSDDTIQIAGGTIVSASRNSMACGANTNAAVHYTGATVTRLTVMDNVIEGTFTYRLLIDNAAVQPNTRAAFTHARLSADRGDNSVTVNAGVDSEVQRFATALTANRTITLSSFSVHSGAKFRIVRTGLGAFTLDVGGLKTIPSATAAFVDVEHDGTAWRLTGYGAL